MYEWSSYLLFNDFEKPKRVSGQNVLQKIIQLENSNCFMLPLGLFKSKLGSNLDQFLSFLKSKGNKNPKNLVITFEIFTRYHRVVL